MASGSISVAIQRVEGDRREESRGNIAEGPVPMSRASEGGLEKGAKDFRRKRRRFGRGGQR